MLTEITQAKVPESKQAVSNTAKRVTGGQLVARALKAEGIKAIFTLSGGHVMDIYNGCAEEGIAIIGVRHEQAAAHAADAWTRLTGIPGCAVVTAGPGVTDALTGVANAWRAQTPMLLIGGQGPLCQHLMGSLQEMDNVDIMRPVTKFATTILETKRIPDLMGMAFRAAYAGRPGPVYIETPMDLLFDEVDENAVINPGMYRTRGKVYGDFKLVEEAACLLSAAQCPAILAGSQVHHCRGVAELQELAIKLGCPVYLNGEARGSLPKDCPVHFERSRREALKRADVVLVLGTPFDFRLGYGKVLGPNAKIIQVDLDETELGHNRGVDVGIIGDSAAVLSQLAAAVKKVPAAQSRSWLEHLRGVEQKAVEEELPSRNSDAAPIHPLRLAKEINEFLTEDAIVVADGGDVVSLAAGVVQRHKPGHWLDPGPLGTLGVGMPFALAAKTAFPDKEVLVVFGDGSFGLNGFEFDTCVRHNLPVIAVVGNNATWGQVRYGQISRYGKARGDIANILLPTRYDRIVEAMGGYGEHVTQPNDIRPALERARDSGKPACVNVMVDPDVYSPTTLRNTFYKY
jgi:acetolactate synthase-1/2/3 large subunit